MKRIERYVVVCLLGIGSLGLVGCAGTVVESGGFEVNEVQFNLAKDRIRPRAAFEFSCAPEDIEFVVLEVEWVYPLLMGATGCGQKATYARREDHTWYMDSATQ